MATAEFPERMVNRVGHRIGVAISEHPVLGPLLLGALNGLAEHEILSAVREIEQHLGREALAAMFPEGWIDA